jgi:hypothetical protein
MASGSKKKVTCDFCSQSQRIWIALRGHSSYASFNFAITYLPQKQFKVYHLACSLDLISQPFSSVFLSQQINISQNQSARNHPAKNLFYF